MFVLSMDTLMNKKPIAVAIVGLLVAPAFVAAAQSPNSFAPSEQSVNIR